LLDAYADAFARYLRTGTVGALSGFCAEGADLGRLRIYRNGFLKACVDALRANYPSVERLVGEARFPALARPFVEVHPPRVASLVEYGSGFPQHLRVTRDMHGLDWLASFAALDRAWTEVCFAADDDIEVKPYRGDSVVLPGSGGRIAANAQPASHLTGPNTSAPGGDGLDSARTPSDSSGWPIAAERLVSDPTDLPIAAERSASDPTDLPIAAERSASDPTDLPITAERAVSDPTDLPVAAEQSASDPIGWPIAAERAASDPTGSPTPVSTDGVPGDAEALMNLRGRLSPWVRLVSLEHCVLDAWRRIREGEPGTEAEFRTGPRQVLVWRSGGEVLYRGLTVPEHTFIAGIAAGHPCGEAAGAALELDVDFDLVATFASLLHHRMLCFEDQEPAGEDARRSGFRVETAHVGAPTRKFHRCAKRGNR